MERVFLLLLEIEGPGTHISQWSCVCQESCQTRDYANVRNRVYDEDVVLLLLYELFLAILLIALKSPHTYSVYSSFYIEPNPLGHIDKQCAIKHLLLPVIEKWMSLLFFSNIP